MKKINNQLITSISVATTIACGIAFAKQTLVEKEDEVNKKETVEEPIKPWKKKLATEEDGILTSKENLTSAKSDTSRELGTARKWAHEMSDIKADEKTVYGTAYYLLRECHYAFM